MKHIAWILLLVILSSIISSLVLPMKMLITQDWVYGCVFGLLCLISISAYCIFTLRKGKKRSSRNTGQGKDINHVGWIWLLVILSCEIPALALPMNPIMQDRVSGLLCLVSINIYCMFVVVRKIK